MDAEGRNKIVDLIEAAITADGVIADEEREFLRRVVERFGLTESDRADRLVSSSAGRATAMLRSFAPDVQLRIMALLVDAAVVDGLVSPDERALLLASAAALGLDATVLEERIAKRLKGAAGANG